MKLIENKELKTQLFYFIIIVLVVASISFATIFEDEFKKPVLIAQIIGIVAMLWIIFQVIYIYISVKPKQILEDIETTINKLNSEYDEAVKKINASVDRLIQKERFVDESILSSIEEKAETIWVVTTKLSTELNSPEIAKAVYNNLKNKKNSRYVYFLPHRNASHFHHLNQNLIDFKKLDFYKDFESQIQFVRLSENTQFLLEEVVIYNPEEREDKDDDINGLNAFTFYESKNEEKSLHMKIEGNMLAHVRDLLRQHLEYQNLQDTVSDIQSNYITKLTPHSKAYLSDLIAKKNSEISNSREHNEFIIEIEGYLSELDSKNIIDMLNKFIKDV